MRLGKCLCAALIVVTLPLSISSWLPSENLGAFISQSRPRPFAVEAKILPPTCHHTKPQELSHYRRTIFSANMKSYIHHLSDSDSSDPRLDTESLGRSDRRLKEGKRRVLARSMSDPLLQVTESQPRRKGGKRTRKRGIVSRSKSFDGEFQLDKSPTNCAKPARRASIEQTTTLKAALEQQYGNARQPTRRGSMMKSSRTMSCSDVFASSKNDNDSRRRAERNLAERAKVLYKALDDMGLFDDDDEVTPSLFTRGMGVEKSLLLAPL